MKTPPEPRRVYVAVVDSKGKVRLGIAVEGEAGYHSVREDSDVGGTFQSMDEAKAVADAYNERLGIDEETAFRIVCGTMRRAIGRN